MLQPRLSTASLIRAHSHRPRLIGAFVRTCLSRHFAQRDDSTGPAAGRVSRRWSGLPSFGPLGQIVLSGAFGLLLCTSLPGSTESAIANGDTRTLYLYNPHTNESIAATYRVNGHYDRAVLEKLNWFLRDWRRNEATHMDPRLFDAVWETYREAGATQPVHVVCGYRSPQTNAMLRHRSRGVAKHSQHMLGKAMDTTMPGMSMEKVREIAMRLQMGGVGFYGDSSFVHIDVGSVRYWPRMTFAQLSRVFPNGKTVLIPSNGKPLRGYEEARAELAASGRVAHVPPSEKGKNFFAWLFGKDRDNADEREEQATHDVAVPPSPASAAVAGGKLARAEAFRDKQFAQASVRSARGHESSTSSAPVPPPRPDDFLALANVPLPPDRPTKRLLVMASLRSGLADDASAKAADPIGDLMKAGTPALAARMGVLPTIITHGANERALARSQSETLARSAPPQALAYAPVAQMEGLRSAVRGKVSGRMGRMGWVAAAASLATPTNVEMAKLAKETIMSPTLTGLRQAARIETAALSQKLAAGYLARFGAVATDLRTDRFAGPAVVGLRAGKSRLMFVGSSGALSKGE